MKIFKRSCLIFSTLLLMTSCGGKSLADNACDAYQSDDLTRIIPAFAALVRDEPLYLDYLEQSRRFVYHQEALLENDGKEGSILDRPVIGSGVTWYEFENAKTALDLFCAR